MGLHTPSTSPSTPEPDLALLWRFWGIVDADDIPPRPASEADVHAARRIVARLAPDEAAVQMVAEFVRGCKPSLPALAAVLARPDLMLRVRLPAQLSWQHILAAFAVREGVSALDHGNQQAAEVYLRFANRTLHALQPLDDRELERRAHLALGRIAMLAGRPGEATEHYLTAFEIDLASGERFNQGTELVQLAEIALLAGQHDGAERLARQALAIYSQDAHRLGSAGALVTLGHIVQAQGHPWRARLSFLRARLLATRTRRSPWIAR